MRFCLLTHRRDSREGRGEARSFLEEVVVCSQETGGLELEKC